MGIITLCNEYGITVMSDKQCENILQYSEKLCLVQAKKNVESRNSLEFDSFGFT